MKEDFKQSIFDLKKNDPKGILKIEKLINIIADHKYLEEIKAAFNIDSTKDEKIVIENIDSAFFGIKNINEKYEKLNIIAETEFVSTQMVDPIEKVVDFIFEEGRVDDELVEGLRAEAIYEARNTFLDEYKMSKYANNLYEKGFDSLVEYNINFFKELAKEKKQYNKKRSYRLLKKNEKYFLRGITSEKYNEYGIDFTFFVTVMLLHLQMKQNKGNSYSIVSLSISESKLDMIIKNNRILTVKDFGQVSLAIKVSTNELGKGSLNVTSAIRVQGNNAEQSLYLFPKERKHLETKRIINHISSLKNVFSKLEDFETVFNISDEFVEDIKDIKGIKHPDELRSKIQRKIEHPNSAFKSFKELKDIFKPNIKNAIDNFSALLQMCMKAEDLDIEYELKEKLRYIISDIILYGNSQN